MSKLLLCLCALILGGFLTDAQAAIRVGNTSVMAFTAGVAKPTCAQCGIYDVPPYGLPLTGDSLTLQPRPLTPESGGHVRMPRR